MPKANMRARISLTDIVTACLVAGFLGFTAEGCWAQKGESVLPESPSDAPSAQPAPKKAPGTTAVDKKVSGPVVEKKPAGPLVDKSNLYGPSVGDDCPPATKFAEGGADGSTRYCLAYEQRASKRCETAYYDFIKRDVDTTIGFDFRLDTSWDFHDVWTSIFQVHSRPNPGGQWRCPISALEVLGHSLRMFDRYDVNATPVLVNGTCADVGNSIRSRTVFDGVPVQAGQWNRFELQTKLGLDESAYFIAKLNGKEIGKVNGPDTYNDEHRPFLKIGIYKPSPWAQAKNLCVDYRNVSIPTER
jgi:hypothetical protein